MKFKTIRLTELIWLVSAVVMMGFCLSFLDLANLGTDPCTTCNLGISHKLGLSLGNWQAFFNCVLFVFVDSLTCENGWVEFGECLRFRAEDVKLLASSHDELDFSKYL